ncbi:multiple PDZ domain protein, partial [Mytilus galloprovincialis]
TLTVGRLKAGSRASSRKQSNPGGLKKSESTASNKSKGGRHSKTVSEDLNHVRIVELTHDVSGSLGLSIAGGIGSSLGDTAVLIANLTPGGAAARSQKLKIGDKIIQINDRETDGMSHDDAVQLLKSGGPVTLMVTQGKIDGITHDDTVQLLKSGGPVTLMVTQGKIDGITHDDTVQLLKSGGPVTLMVTQGKLDGITHDDAVQLLKSGGPITLMVTLGKLDGITHDDAVQLLKSGGPITLMVTQGKIDGITHDDAVQLQKSGGPITLMVTQGKLNGITHDDAVQLFKSGGLVTLMVTQGEETRVSVTGGKASRPVSADMTPQDNAVFDDDGAPPQCKTITLNRGPAGLGFSIVGGHGSPHGDLPIYVKSVFAQGAASVEGNLKRGDQILSVNGQSLEGCTHEEAVNILKNAKGNVTLMVLSS